MHFPGTGAPRVWAGGVLTLLCAAGCGGSCPYNSSVDISGGVRQANGSILHEDIMYAPSEMLAGEKGEAARGCVCQKKACIRKCCPEGQLFEDYKCVAANMAPFNPLIFNGMNEQPIFKNEHDIHLLYENPCQELSITINTTSSSPSANDGYQYYLQKDGHLLFRFSPEESFINFPAADYCVETWLEGPGSHALYPMVCYPYPDATSDVVLSVGMLISIPFLLATFLVYAFIPELQNLHGKALMTYVLGLATAYSCTAASKIGQQNRHRDVTFAECHCLAFLMYFSYLLSFFWLNVMCTDIWLTFTGYSGPVGWRASERRRFRLYCAYAWGAPLLLVGLAALLQLLPGVPAHVVRPGVSLERCWFNGSQAVLLYFYTPMVVLVACNVAMFLGTVYRIAQVRRETAMLSAGGSARHARGQQQSKIQLFLKLFVVMGISLTAEFASYVAGGSDYYWIIFDFCNTIQGVLIFFIFVFKPKIKTLLVKRYHALRYGAKAPGTHEETQLRTYRRTSSLVPTETSFTQYDVNGDDSGKK